MIRLNRLRTDAAISKAFYGTKRVAKEFALLRAKRDGKLATHLTSSLWKKAKPQLKIEANDGKCAYCEYPAAGPTHGDVEHFRPKSIWWWLACCYDNYVFSCQICNQVYKADNFPLSPGCKPRGLPKIKTTDSDLHLSALAGTLAPDPLSVTLGRTLAVYMRDCTAEKPLLISPYLEDPEEIIAYEADSTLREVRVCSRKRSHIARIKACEEYLGLNREQLCRDRWKCYQPIEKTWLVWKRAKAVDKPDLAQVLSFAVRDEAFFAGMARYFIRKVWKVPGV